MRPRSQCDRSCSGSGTRSPSASSRAARRASVRSMSARSAATSPSSGAAASSMRWQSNRLVGQLDPLQRRTAARGVALIEDQVEDVEHRAQAIRALHGLRHGEGHARLADARLCPADPLRHRGFGEQERTRDLGGRQAAHRPQRQRDRGSRRQRRMAAQEQKDERVVLLEDRRRRRPFPRCDDLLPVHAGTIRPPRIDQPAGGAAGEPSLRLLRDSRAGPAVGGRDERLLDGVLRRVEVAVPARERAKDPRRELAQQVLDITLRRQRWPPAVWAYSSISSDVDGPSSMIRRTWTGCWSGRPPGPGTADTRAAISRARSSDSTSTIW